MFSIFDEVHILRVQNTFFFFFHFPASAGNHLYQFVFPGTINLMNFPSVFWRSNVFLWLVFKMRFTGTKMSKLWKFELFWGETITFSVLFLLKFSVKNKYECFYASHSDLLKTYYDSLMRNPFFSSNFENCLEEHTAWESSWMWLLLCLCSRAWEALSVRVVWEPQALPACLPWVDVWLRMWWWFLVWFILWQSVILWQSPF